MEIMQLKQEASSLRQEIVKLLREFEEKHDVTVNVAVYHRILTFDEKIRRNTVRVDGQEEQIAEVSLTLNL